RGDLQRDQFGAARVPYDAASAVPDVAIIVTIDARDELRARHGSECSRCGDFERTWIEVDADQQRARLAGCDGEAVRTVGQLEACQSRLAKAIHAAGGADPDVTFTVFEECVGVGRGQAVEVREYIARRVGRDVL